jgi:hypothetical protein
VRTPDPARRCGLRSPTGADYATRRSLRAHSRARDCAGVAAGPRPGGVPRRGNGRPRRLGTPLRLGCGGRSHGGRCLDRRLRLHRRLRRGSSRLHDLRLRRRVGRRRAGGGQGPGREKAKGIDVSLLVARDPDAEVDVGLGQVDLAARPHRPDRRAFTYGRPALDGDRSEVHERQRVTGGCLNRHRLAAGRHGAREGHDAGRRREHRSAARCAEVDAAVLSGGVRMRPVERERSQDRTVDRPRPGLGNRHGQCARTTDHQNHESPHDLFLLVASFENGVDSSKADPPLSILATRYGGRARCARRPSVARRSLQLAGVAGPRPRAPQPPRRRARPRTPSSRARAPT